MYLKSGISQKLQKMQILCANHLHVEKENQQEVFHEQQEERGIKNITHIGDHVECPECKRTSRIIWVSKDGKTAGIQCPASHSLADHPDSKLTAYSHATPKTSKHMVFITKIK